ncbi:MAG: NitT/TauT family transport system substrate-binding protein [Methylobacteriaceae bacterium]|jgi:NitT/TauT family transport system substrate-binding protein|nr:NitT/TauT family transport system substrate-binding protein [Methylobacteriaceae bacterium]
MKLTRRTFGICLAATAVGSAFAQDRVKIRLGVLRLASSGNVFIAADRGYFREAGLDVELKFFDAAQPIAVATASGDIDIGVTAFTGGLFNLAGKGAVSIIAGQSRDVPGFPLMAYLATTQPSGASLKSLKDIEGKSVGVTQIGSSFHYSAGLIAEKYKFPLSDVRFVPLQSMANVASALKGGRVEAAILPATAAQPLIDSGDARLIGWGGDEAPWQLGAVFVSQKMKANADVVERFLAAYRRGCKDYHDILLASVKNGIATLTPQTQPLLEAIARETNQPVDKIRVGLAFIDPNGGLDVQGVAHQLAWFQDHGFVDKGFGLDKIVDPRFVKLP